MVVSGVMAVAASARCGPEAAKKVGKGEGEEMVVVVVKVVEEDAGRREAGQGRVRDEEGRGGGWY